MMYTLLIYAGTLAATVRSALRHGAALDRERVHGTREEHGVLGHGQLQPPESSTTVRAEHGKTLTTDGPFVGMKEALGGWFMLEADDLDAAHRGRGARSRPRGSAARSRSARSEVYW